MPESMDDVTEDQRQRLFGRKVIQAFSSGDSYGVVLLLIIASYLFAVSVTARWAMSAVLVVQIATVWFALHTSHSRRSVRIVALAVMALSAVIAVENLFASDSARQLSLVFLVASLLYLIAPFSILRHLLTRQVVDIQTVLGALAAYLLFGMFFAFAYQAMAHMQSSAFFGTSGDGTFPQDLFFSFTTLTTTGYGNLVPAGNPGQSMAVLEMLVGQLFLISAVAKVINAWQPKRSRLGQGSGSSSEPT